MAKILIIGGGAAGMAAAVFLGEKNHQVHLFEKNEKLGKNCLLPEKDAAILPIPVTMKRFFKSVVTNAKFLYSAFYGYSNQDVVSFFENLGLAVKEERGGRIFPVSDHSSDVIRILEKRMKELDVKVHLKKRGRSSFDRRRRERRKENKRRTSSKRCGDFG